MFGFGKTRQEELTKEEEAKVNEKFNSFKNKKYSQEDAYKVLDNEEKIMGMMDSGKLAEFKDDVITFFSMVKDFCSGKYKKAPMGTIIAVVATLLYVLSPIDLIPDVIPVLGLADDAAMLALCMKFAKSDVEDYKLWQKRGE